MALDKEKVKTESIKFGAEYAFRLAKVPLSEGEQGALQGWDKFPSDYLPSIFELGNFALYRSGHGHIKDETLNEHQDWALSKTLELRKKAGAGSSSGKRVGIVSLEGATFTDDGYEN